MTGLLMQTTLKIHKTGNLFFCDLQEVVVPNYVISPFECANELSDLEPSLNAQLFQIRMDL